MFSIVTSTEGRQNVIRELQVPISIIHGAGANQIALRCLGKLKERILRSLYTRTRSA